jgi:hypothetical protein
LASKNFAIRELYRSETAARQEIDNFPGEEALHSAVFLAREVLQPVRDHFGSFSPNSVYRCQALERALKGKPADWVSRSQHTKGQAADVEVPGVPNRVLAGWIAGNLEFDQLILELFDPAQGPNSGWVHVSRKRGENRGELLSYVKRPGGYVYVNGLVDS